MKVDGKRNNKKIGRSRRTKTTSKKNLWWNSWDNRKEINYEFITYMFNNER